MKNHIVKFYIFFEMLWQSIIPYYSSKDITQYGTSRITIPTMIDSSNYRLFKIAIILYYAIYSNG